MRYAILFFVCGLLSFSAFAQLKVARVFGSHAVLQRQKPVPVWGWAGKGEKVTVAFNGQTVSGKADNTGKWTVLLAQMPAGGPFTMTIRDKKNTITLEDILVGEVWLCSGQSNMEWSVAQTQNAQAEIREATHPNIRHFFVSHELSLQPEADLKNGDWKVCSPETVGSFTAVGYFFAREIEQKLGVPVGLLHSSWGGSQLEGWISRESMLSSPELKDYPPAMPTTWEGAKKSLDERMKMHVFGKKDVTRTAEDEKKYLGAGYDFSDWSNYNVPGSWDWQGVWAFRGTGYVARALDIPAGLVGKSAVLGFGENDSPYQLYLNGILLSEKQQKGKRTLTLPAGTFKPGKNTLLLKQAAHQDPDWYGMGLHGAKADYYLDFGSEKIPLAGDGWKLMPALSEKYEFVKLNNNLGITIYNAMIEPLVPYALQGVLWYQGESNAGRAYQYRKTFPLLIQDWRTKWKDEFSFLFVQLSSFGSTRSSNEGSNWAELREAQTMTLSLPKTGMAVTTDIGNPNDIHPTNKQDVGKRLAAAALKVTYHQDNVPQSPMFESVKFENGKALISFSQTGKGLMTKDKYGYVRGFEIAGADKVFYYAKAEIVNGKVVAYHAAVPSPVAVRFAWADAPEDANLFSADGFPACPFRTDDWEGKTAKVKFE